MRNDSLVGSENEYGHILSNANHTGSDKKDPDNNAHFYLGPVVQSIVSLTSSLRVISLTI